MNCAPAELLKSYVQNQRFTSTTEVMEAMKDMFRDVIQQVMEGELEDELGYEKSERVSKTDDAQLSKNYRKVTPKRP